MKGVVPVQHQPFQRRMKPGILALFINRQAVLQVIIWQLTSHIHYQSARNRKDCRNQPFFLFPSERYIHSDRIVTFDQPPYHRGIDHLLVVCQALHKTVLTCFLTKKDGSV